MKVQEFKQLGIQTTCLDFNVFRFQYIEITLPILKPKLRAIKGSFSRRFSLIFNLSDFKFRNFLL